VNLIAWVGPVSSSNLGPVPSTAKLATVNRGIGGGIGSTDFRMLATLDGYPLERAAKSAGIHWDDVERLIILGFSAAHGWMDPVLREARYRERIVLVGACDAYFTNALLARKTGYAAAAADAIDGKYPFVMTSSPVAGPDYPSGNAAVAAFVAPFALEQRDVPTWCPPGALAGQAQGSGLFTWIPYDNAGGNLKHAHVKHATEVAPALLSAVGAPLLAASGDGSGGGGVAALIGIAAALSLLGGLKA
jgi:hypothetical protein